MPPFLSFGCADIVKKNLLCEYGSGEVHISKKIQRRKSIMAKKKFKRFIALGLVCLTVMATSVPSFAASITNPTMTQSCSTSKASASMSIGSDTAKLEIMFLMTQTSETDAYDTRTPQYMHSKNGSSVSGSRSALSGYEIDYTDFKFYVDNVTMKTIRKYA